MVQQVPNFPLVSLTTISKHVAKFRTSSSSTAIAFRFLMLGSEMFFRAFVVVLVSTACLASHSFGADFATPTGQTDATPTLKMPAANLLRPDLIFVFGGALSTESLGDTLQFDLDRPAAIKYDNYIAGLAYNHDFYYLGYGFTLGGEIGVADRFGYYALCCDTVVKSTSLLNSGELWTGPRISFQGFVLFDTIRIAGAATTGFSFTTNSIGREREREIALDGSARALIYFGPELSFSLVNYPEWEFVYRVQHRSGADGTFGNLREGYNANVFGVRYKF